MNNKEYCVLKNVDLWQFNTMKIHSNAQELILPYTVNGLIDFCKSHTSAKEFIIIGKASNTIFSKSNYSISITCTNLVNLLAFNGGKIYAQCGASLNDLAWFARDKSVAGCEFLEDIPGSVGGALYMNAGTHDGTISEIVYSVRVYDFKSHKIIELAREELAPYWGSRKSYFQEHDCCVLDCVIETGSCDDPDTIMERMLEIKQKRYKKQPREYPSAGSVFKRPCSSGEPIYVWKLLEEAGLRGYSIGGAQVSQKHPGFIINADNSTGKDLVMLLELCKKKIKDKFGIILEEEWKIV